MKIKKALKALETLLGYIIALLMAAMVVILLWQVFARKVLQDSTGWTSEVATLLFVWASMLGAAYAVRAGGHVAMTMFVNKFKGRKLHTVFSLVATLFCEGFFAIMLYGGITMSDKLSKAVTAQLRIPMPWAYAPFIIAGIFALLFGLEQIVEDIIVLVKKPDDPNELKGGVQSCQ